MSESLKTQLLHVGFRTVGEIRDAEKDLNIFINTDDIVRGLPHNPMQCTTARCLQRAIGLDGTKAAVFLHTAYVQVPGVSEVIRYTVPEALRQNVIVPQDNAGDPTSEIRPGIYKIKAPSKTRRLGAAAVRRERLRSLRHRGLIPLASKHPEQRIPHKIYIRLRWQRDD